MTKPACRLLPLIVIFLPVFGPETAEQDARRCHFHFPGLTIILKAQQLLVNGAASYYPSSRSVQTQLFTMSHVRLSPPPLQAVGSVRHILGAYRVCLTNGRPGKPWRSALFSLSVCVSSLSWTRAYGPSSLCRKHRPANQDDKTPSTPCLRLHLRAIFYRLPRLLLFFFSVLPRVAPQPLIVLISGVHETYRTTSLVSPSPSLSLFVSSVYIVYWSPPCTSGRTSTQHYASRLSSIARL